MRTSRFNQAQCRASLVQGLRGTVFCTLLRPPRIAGWYQWLFQTDSSTGPSLHIEAVCRGEVLATHRDVGAGAVRQIAQTSSGMGFMVATSAGDVAFCHESLQETRACRTAEGQHATRAPEHQASVLESNGAAPTKEVSLELKAMLDSKMSIDSPIFVAEGGYRGTRSGYLFRHGKHGLGYYRADKLVETEALHHSHVKDQPLRASETLQQDEQPACNSPAESSAQSAHGQHIRHQPGHERSRSPVSLQPEQDMASEQIRCHQGAEGLADVVRPMECKRGGSGAAARSETKDAAAAPESASDARQSSAEQISGVERAFDNPDVWDRK
ncbi:hypothetical protein WJX74_005596 [Apatococcus lobatus]|uniref:Uncharacterized protein n=1 Tax=Apatococcus lobatus TaxID=904363 RepID=A0AAW1RWW5_9CHLO